MAEARTSRTRQQSTNGDSLPRQLSNRAGKRLSNRAGSHRDRHSASQQAPQHSRHSAMTKPRSSEQAKMTDYAVAHLAQLFAKSLFLQAGSKLCRSAFRSTSCKEAATI